MCPQGAAASQKRGAAAQVDGLAAEFADDAQVQQMLAALGPVDVLINNVGIFGLEEFAAISDDTWRKYFDINVLSAVRLSRHVLPAMTDRGWGRIIFINSESGVNVPADMTHYGATKAALLGLANGLAKLTRGTEITVNTILGGPTYSDGVAAAVEQVARANGLPTSTMKDNIAAANTTSLLGRFIDPAEIASLVAYLASPLSAATNGAAVRADGGVLTSLL